MKNTNRKYIKVNKQKFKINERECELRKNRVKGLSILTWEII